MRIVITGGTGFVGRHLARRLVSEGHEVVLISRGVDAREPSVRDLRGARFVATGVEDADGLADAFEGCDAVAHLAGINREVGEQTFEAVHVEGTRNVVDAAEASGVPRIALMSFLRARPDCGSGYHESKWRAEEIVRASSLEFTVLKAGVIYGDGDHMLDHLSHAFYTFPVFGLVGLKPRPVRPVAVEDVVTVLRAALVDRRLTDRTVAVTGPDEMTLEEAVRKVAGVVDRHPLFVRLPIAIHYGLAWLFERTMKIPLVARAQVRILSEGIVDPAPSADELPPDLRPSTPFSAESIRRGLPSPGPFGVEDLRCAVCRSAVVP